MLRSAFSLPFASSFNKSMPSTSVRDNLDATECVDHRNKQGDAAPETSQGTGSKDSVTPKDRAKTVNLIESAMLRSSQASHAGTCPQAREAPAPAPRLDVQDDALKRRLAQLEYAQAERTPDAGPPSPPLREASAPALVAQPAPTHAGHSGATSARRVRALWGAALGALLLAGGLASYLHQDAQILPPLQPTVPLPTAPMPAPPVMAMAAVPAPAPQADDMAQVRAQMERWRQAWMARDAAAYLACYSPHFVPTKGQPYALWQKARRKALDRPTGIEIRISNLRLQRVDQNQVKADFLQDYVSGTYRENGLSKTLVLERAGSGWVITREWDKVTAADKGKSN